MKENNDEFDTNDEEEDNIALAVGGIVRAAADFIFIICRGVDPLSGRWQGYSQALQRLL